MEYGLVGEKLSHSYSKTVHQLQGNKSYDLLDISPGELGSFLKSARFKGVNVTIPYKQDVIPFCVLSETARRIGSVNTIINREGVLYGYNTDYDGFMHMTQKADIDFKEKKVLILGSGGTSKTILCAMKDYGAKEIVVISRNGENNYQNIDRHNDGQIIINTTPVGMYPENDMTPVDISIFKQLAFVVDVIYNPFKTRLLLDAQKMGIKYINGFLMLIAQARFSHKLFFDITCKPAEDAKIIKEISKKIEKAFKNIVLIGMPGCGKTTIGHELALRLGLKFVDTDIEIEKMIGKPVPDIIREDGESAFRKIENYIITKTAKEKGQVIATGGGSVILPQNKDALKQNGIILFLDCDISKLATDNRPLSKNNDSLRGLYNTRYPIYKALCDKKITVNDEIENNILKILETLK